MEVCLINPEASRYGGEPERLGEPLFPPLGLMTVAALTPQKHNVTLLDESIEAVDLDIDPDIVGLTGMTAAAPRAYEIADRFRRRGIPVVMGGMHASALPEEALEHVDSVVVGEGEGQWPQLLKDFENNDMQPVYDRDGYPDPADIPPARRDLVDLDEYVAKYTLQATRGCPFNCSFCAVTSFFGHTYRTRPIDDVAEEMEQLGEPVVLVDDNIMGHPSYARQLFDRLAEVKKSFVSQASATMLKTPELIARAAEAGCRGLFVGLESISQTQLAKMGKSHNIVKRYNELIQRLHDHGIAVVGSFMFGLDGDDSDIFSRTLEFAEDAAIDVAQFSILTPFPGTQLYNKLRDEGRIVEKDWSKFNGSWATFDPLGDGLTREVLDEGLRWIHKRFYSWSSILKRTARRIQPVIWKINAIYHDHVARWTAQDA